MSSSQRREGRKEPDAAWQDTSILRDVRLIELDARLNQELLPERILGPDKRAKLRA